MVRETGLGIRAQAVQVMDGRVDAVGYEIALLAG